MLQHEKKLISLNLSPPFSFALLSFHLSRNSHQDSVSWCVRPTYVYVWNVLCPDGLLLTFHFHLWQKKWLITLKKRVGPIKTRQFPWHFQMSAVWNIDLCNHGVLQNSHIPCRAQHWIKVRGDETWQGLCP